MEPTKDNLCSITYVDTERYQKYLKGKRNEKWRILMVYILKFMYTSQTNFKSIISWSLVNQQCMHLSFAPQASVWLEALELRFCKCMDALAVDALVWEWMRVDLMAQTPGSVELQ